MQQLSAWLQQFLAAWRWGADEGAKTKPMPICATTTTPTPQPPAIGGRAASPETRHADWQRETFVGLEHGVDRYELLTLVKRAGRHAGFSPRMISLLDYYFAYTRACDWEEGSRPVVFQSLARTALDLGISERQVQRLENSLFELGAIAWNDSGNHRRFGQRCPESGRLLYAYGVELTPLAYLREELEEKLAEKQRHDELWLAAKRSISEARREIRALLDEASLRGVAVERLSSRLELIAGRVRTHLALSDLHQLLAEHRQLAEDLRREVAAGDLPPSSTRCRQDRRQTESPQGDISDVPYKYTTQEINQDCSRDDACLQESVPERPARDRARPSTGIEHISLGMAVEAASDRFAGGLPEQPAWSDLVQAADRLRPRLGISQASWAEACGVMGRDSAAICLLLTDRQMTRPQEPVRQPAAYFRGLTRRAERAELRLHASLFGIGSGDRVASKPAEKRPL